MGPVPRTKKKMIHKAVKQIFDEPNFLGDLLSRCFHDTVDRRPVVSGKPKHRYYPRVIFLLADGKTSVRTLRGGRHIFEIKQTA